jgi:predicted lipoprotein with Yx(FWY)xxD motif
MKARFALLLGAVLLSACGGSKSSSPPPTSAGSNTGSATVSTRNVSGTGTVLVDAKGDALYSPAEEKNGTIHCTGGCTAVWIPLTVAAGTTPTAGSGISGKLGTVKRPDGKRQVTWNGSPLYTFADDGGPGDVMGNGATDNFSGMSFTWHVATAGKGSAPAPSTSTSGGGGGGGGY